MNIKETCGKIARERFSAKHNIFFGDKAIQVSHVNKLFLKLKSKSYRSYTTGVKTKKIP